MQTCVRRALGATGGRARLAVVSAADPVSRTTGRLVHLPDAPFLLGDLSPVQVLSGLVDGPVVVDNDVNWAAQAERDRRPEFAETARPLLFTGETMFPWMFDEIRALGPFREVADLLAARTDWPALYDLDALASNEVPLEAAVYHDDMYVDAPLQLDTAAHIGKPAPSTITSQRITE